jgi:hypothetical protein
MAKEMKQHHNPFRTFRIFSTFFFVLYSREALFAHNKQCEVGKEIKIGKFKRSDLSIPFFLLLHRKKLTFISVK